ncbi:MAG: CNNM domain-containing protein, partial [Burkholderiaceae bacterium]|nr:CNNM domain-containing protein [Burkholderiaceae bacterium]
MDTVPLWAQICALVFLIFCSAFFSISETALIAISSYRVKHLAKAGSKRAQTTQWLLARTDRLLSLVLIAQTLLNSLVTALVTAIAIQSFGSNQKVLTIATAIIAFLLIIFAEITPKVVGATYPERIALPAAPILKPLMLIAQPAIWFVNLFVNLLLNLLRIKTGAGAHKQRLSLEELRTIVLEGGAFIPKKHKSILLNLFDLESITVEDVMTPRTHVEALDLAVPIDDIKRQLATCYHNKLPVYEGEINHIIGVLHVRKAVALL